MSVPIVFDKSRELKFDLRAIKDLENAMGGRPLGSIVGDLANLGITALTLALWAGLKHEDRSLSPSLVTKMLESYIAEKKSLRTLGQKVNDAIDETGLFRNEDEDEPVDDAEGNERPEPAART